MKSCKAKSYRGIECHACVLRWFSFYGSVWLPKTSCVDAPLSLGGSWQKFGTKSKKHAAYMKCEIRSLLQTIQCNEWRNRQTLVNCPRLQQFFCILPPRTLKITTIVMNINWRFHHLLTQPFHPNQRYWLSLLELLPRLGIASFCYRLEGKFYVSSMSFKA